MRDFRSKLLEYYGLSEEEYNELLKPISLENLPNSFNCKDMESCVNFIKQKINNGTKVLIYGDYDCDGIISTAIIYLTLKAESFIPGYYIPFRETDGYGLTKNNVDKFFDLGYRLLILVDNGITLVDEINYAREKGMDVVIIDHHIKGNMLPNANYILHPIYSNFVDVNMSAGALSFFFSKSFLGYFDRYLLVLGAISIISDLMEMKKYNKNLVKLGIQILNEDKFFNIIHLINLKNSEPINEDDISMDFVPKINAIGRLIDDNKLFNVVKYLINKDDKEFIVKTAQWIEDINSYRKDLLLSIGDRFKNVNSSKSSLVVIEDNLKEGLTGLLASKLMNEYNKPTVVFAKQKNNPYIYKGSVRSKPGFDIDAALKELSPILETFGGHKNAGGLSIKEQNFDKFCTIFEELSNKYPFIDDEKYIKINLNDINLENYKLIRTLSPFGQGFKKPQFKLENYNTDFFNYSKNCLHIITKLNPTSSMVYFNYNHDILSSKFVDLLGTFELNIFKGFYSVQFTINNFIKK